MSDKPFPLDAEQLVDLVAEAVAIIVEAATGGRLPKTHMDSPSYRLAVAGSVTPRCLRDPAAKVSRPESEPASTGRATSNEAQPRIAARTADGHFVTVTMLPEKPLGSYQGGRAILTLNEAARLRDALNEALEIEVLRGAVAEAQAKLDARLAS